MKYESDMLLNINKMCINNNFMKKTWTEDFVAGWIQGKKRIHKSTAGICLEMHKFLQNQKGGQNIRRDTPSGMSLRL